MTSSGRTLLAVLLGYLTFLILEIIGAFMTASVLRARSGAALLISGEIVTFIAAALAGAVTARIARSRPLAHAGALGLAMFSVTVVVTAVAPHRAASPYPGWYPYAIALLSGVGAFLGGAFVRSGSEAEA